jgi:acetyl esterase/lipase
MSMTHASGDGSALAVDSTCAAGIKPLAIPSHGETLCGACFGSMDASPRGTVVLLHDLQEAGRDIAMAHSIRRGGFHAVTFRYRGAWGNGGRFSLRHCLEDVRACVAYLRRTEVAAGLGVHPSRLILLGHGMGAAMAGLAAASDRGVAGVGMIGPWNIGAASAGRTDAFDRCLRSALRREARTLACAGGESLYDEAARHANWNLAACVHAWRDRPVLLVTANDLFHRQGMDVAQACRRAGHAALTDVHIPTDRFHSDSRDALHGHVLSWLTRIAALPYPLPPRAESLLRQPEWPARSPVALSGFTQNRQPADIIDTGVA